MLSYSADQNWDFNPRSYLHAASAIALLYARVDSNIIKMIGCWRSNGMLRYLHVQVELLRRNFSQLILTDENNSFLPQ